MLHSRRIIYCGYFSYIRYVAALLGTAAISDRMCLSSIHYEGDTATPGGLHARLCHAISSFFNHFSQRERILTRNVWQCPTYSPLGAVVSPLANNNETHLLIAAGDK